MGSKLNLHIIFLLFFTLYVVQAQDFDVTKYGGAAGADITQALLNAWKDACAATGTAQVIIPKGTYTLNEVKFLGPCKGEIIFRVEGLVQAPPDPAAIKSDAWVVFETITGLTVFGGGTFDGQGQKAWTVNDCSMHFDTCRILPTNVRFNFITNGFIHDITSLNSKMFNLFLLGGNNVTFQHITVTAPANSLNTDGIHIGRSTGVKILDTTIGTGDDCVSVGDGTKDLTVSKVTCGPGHGISIGSLGKYDNEGPVAGVHVSDCTLTNTDNGVRIKTWPNSKPGSASDISFTGITMNNVSNPIILDQNYCPHAICDKQPSRVKVSGVKFDNIKGTSATQQCVILSCSPAVPCENVEIGEINLVYNGPLGPGNSTCLNVKPTFTGHQVPPVCTPPQA
uniref:Exopolygalacturonase-like n=1 Tax=Nelumbo nucifera TaxID=4432 RepID=A0A822YWP2_NELNU|nr:TPA_asm: hypothetical protein HUJ06_006399 [Nelumbo nucifera]